MTRASDISTYDDDFFAWTQEQAAALRRLPREAIGDAVDIAHVAEEIEDLGKRDLREVTSFLARLFEHLMKIDNSPASRDAPHWRSEARTFQQGACDAFSPGMRRALVVDAIWRKAHRRLAQDMSDRKTILLAPTSSPCKLDEFLDEDFDLDAALAKLAAARPSQALDRTRSRRYHRPLTLGSLSDDPFPSPPRPPRAEPNLGDLPEWNLADLYPAMDSPAFADDVKRALADCAGFAADYKGKLEALARDGGLIAAIRRYEAIDDTLGRIMSYAGLVYAGDTTDPARSKFYADAQDKVTTASTDLLFFQLELNRVEDSILDAAAAGACAHYKPWLDDIRKDKPFQLDDKLEQLFLEKGTTGASAWNRLFDETMAALRFDVDGEALALEPTLSLLQDEDGAVRHRAADALSKGLQANVRTFALVTNTLAKDKEIADRWRGFSDVADARHLSNRIEREVVDALVAAVRAAYPRLSHRYYKLKAKWFGVDALPHWDRNAPLPDVPSRALPWTEARTTVLDAYAGFSPKMAGIAQRFFDERWIDAPTRPGKAPGAFAHPTVPSAHPYVLLNYQGKPRDVMTLAHELGHGVHQVLAGPQGALMAPTPLTLAETASVFGEMLTFRALLDRTGSVAERRAMLAAKVEDMINTVVRQVAFYSFERKLHLARREGELTSDAISEIWMSVQAESLGPAIRLMPGYEIFWSYIPHFIHSPFYVYAYAFGDCLVNSLYGVFEKAQDGFAERYLAMLSAGGTKHHSELLAPFGLDATDPGFWQIGLGMIEGLIAELEAME